MHTGHRQRMYAKLRENAGLYDHELLEILLYNAYPRIDTNEISHKILKKFFTVKKVLNAKYEELIALDCIGESVANYLYCVGRCLERVSSLEGDYKFKTRGDLLEFIKLRFKGRKEEFLELYFTEKNGDLLRVYSYTSADLNRVCADPREIVSNLSNVKPFGLIAAHNHISGSSSPSATDDSFMAVLQMVCNLNGIELLDHMIYKSDSDVFSYYDSGKMESIKKHFTINGYIRWVEGNDDSNVEPPDKNPTE